MSATSSRKRVAQRTPSSGTYRVAPAPPVASTSDRRAILAAKLLDVAAELREIGADDLRLAADVVTAVAFPVEHFEGEEIRKERGAWIEAMVALLNVLPRH